MKTRVMRSSTRARRRRSAGVAIPGNISGKRHGDRRDCLTTTNCTPYVFTILVTGIVATTFAVNWTTATTGSGAGCADNNDDLRPRGLDGGAERDLRTGPEQPDQFRPCSHSAHRSASASSRTIWRMASRLWTLAASMECGDAIGLTRSSRSPPRSKASAGPKSRRCGNSEQPALRAVAGELIPATELDLTDGPAHRRSTPSICSSRGASDSPTRSVCFCGETVSERDA